MLRIYKCRKCGKQHPSPTGKHCRELEHEQLGAEQMAAPSDNDTAETLGEIMTILMEVKATVAEVVERVAVVENRGDETGLLQASANNIEQDGANIEANGSVQPDETDGYATADTLRKDVRAMQRAAERIAQCQLDDSDDEDMHGQTVRSPDRCLRRQKTSNVE